MINRGFRLSELYINIIKLRKLIKGYLMKRWFKKSGRKIFIGNNTQIMFKKNIILGNIS